MTKKVKLTGEQAEAIKEVTKLGVGRIVEKQLRKDWNIIQLRCLNHLSIKQFLDAIYIGYEVEETFKVGDWIYSKQVEKFIKIEDEGQLEGYNKFPSYYRSATPEEIAKEKQRRWWAEHGRNVWELREGDCLISKYDKHTCQVKFVESSDEVSVLLVDGIQDEFYEGEHDLQILRDSYKVFCFAEDRKDLKE